MRARTEHKGFTVSDNKPQHIIVRPTPDGQLVKDRSGKPAVRPGRLRTAEANARAEERLRAKKRQDYLVRQAHRFEPHEEFPPGSRR